MEEIYPGKRAPWGWGLLPCLGWWGSLGNRISATSSRAQLQTLALLLPSNTVAGHYVLSHVTFQDLWNQCSTKPVVCYSRVHAEISSQALLEGLFWSLWQSSELAKNDESLYIMSSLYSRLILFMTWIAFSLNYSFRKDGDNFCPQAIWFGKIKISYFVLQESSGFTSNLLSLFLERSHIFFLAWSDTRKWRRTCSTIQNKA